MIQHGLRDMIVTMLVESIIHERVDADKITPGMVRATVDFTLYQHKNLPDYLVTPMYAVTILFSMSTIAMTGRHFHRLPHHRRCHQIRAWRDSAIGFRRDFIRFHETMAMFGCYSEIYDGAALGGSSVEHSQAAE